MTHHRETVVNGASSSNHDHSVPTPQRLDAEEWAVNDVFDALKKLRAKRLSLTNALGALDVKRRQSRDLAYQQAIYAEMSTVAAQVKETDREILAFEKKLHNLKSLNKHTARRHQWEQKGLLKEESSNPSLGLPNAVKVAKYGYQARDGHHDQRKHDGQPR
ncbi:unnamed protein product [Peniophora sp. CBMAI 1063]|nr:unnamed protein product [Peniophora sp. CBMAI 1063]